MYSAQATPGPDGSVCCRQSGSWRKAHTSLPSALHTPSGSSAIAGQITGSLGFEGSVGVPEPGLPGVLPPPEPELQSGSCSLMHGFVGSSLQTPSGSCAMRVQAMGWLGLL